jgi:O-succinylbenzoic acid--CoA ligase
LDDWLGHRARTHAERPALIAEAGIVTYAELDAGASRTARRLKALGIAPGARVATTLAPGVAFAELLHALPRAGASLVPLNTRLTGAERRWQVEDCGAALTVEEPLDGKEQEPLDGKEQEPTDAQRPEEWALVYTSGTSGTPRGVSLSHDNFAASAFASAWNLGVDPDDRWLCVLPLFHVGGLSILTRSAIYGTAAVIQPFEVEPVKAALENGEITLASLVPTMLRRLADAGLEQAPALRAALLGGGPVPRDLLAWANERGLPMLQTYGMTETCSQIATASAATGGARLLPGVDVSISDEGEILVRGPMVSRGALVEDGWLHTGDRGHLDEQGQLWVDGRLKDVIVTGGENVACAEVERVLEDHAAVIEAAVVGAPDAEWGEVVTAYVVLADGVPDADLIAHCRQQLAGYKAPRAIHRVEALPRNAAGKLLRRELGGEARHSTL